MKNKGRKMLILTDIATTDFNTYNGSSQVEIARVDLHHSGRFYDRCYIRARVTTALIAQTSWTTLTFFANQHHDATSTVGYDALSVSKADTVDHTDTSKTFSGISSKILAVDNWETFKVHPKTSVSATTDGYWFDDKLYERYVSFNCTHNMVGASAGIIAWDAILTSSDTSNRAL